jgi:hypothetical protein
MDKFLTGGFYGEKNFREKNFYNGGGSCFGVCGRRGDVPGVNRADNRFTRAHGGSGR